MLPARIFAGDTFGLTESLPDYPASAGWVLSLRLIPRDGTGAAIDVASVASGDDHVLGELAANTAAWAPLVYSWVESAALAGVVQTVATGTVEVLPDPRVSPAALDLRTDARKALDNVLALIRGKATRDVLSYSINGRELRHYSMAELQALRTMLAQDVQAEQASADRATGKPNRSKVYVGLARA